ncbi:MAG: RNHCP domain-containing protein [Deltaproteobacteria bacterium]|nr:MAG: RNHCP domain-containing protein [Deltaproteobacteria bacterium]
MSRGQVKRAGEELDGRPELRRAVVDVARERGIELRGSQSLAGKKLLRHARDRALSAQVRTNPIARDEAFVCAHCGHQVEAHGRTARDHCPRCLRSVHVDIVPGDRAAGCGGVLDPVCVETRGSRLTIHYRCRRCAAARVNRAILDGDDPDDWDLLSALSAGEVLS